MEVVLRFLRNKFIKENMIIMLKHRVVKKIEMVFILESL